MPTHTDNRHYGNSVVDSVIEIDTFNQVDGLNPESILSFLPTVHDLSAQVLGNNKEFDLSPPIAQGTQNMFVLFLDGVQLLRSQVFNGSDFFIREDLQTIVLGEDLPTPPQGSTLVAIYVEHNLA
jgi:hypothetical protein